MSNLTSEISDKLLSYQIPHAKQLLSALDNYGRAIDASDTGTGKTFSAIAIAKSLNLQPIVICPKSVIPSWIKAMKHFDMSDKYYGIANYELIKNCKWYQCGDYPERSKCEYLNKKDISDKKLEKSDEKIDINNSEGKKKIHHKTLSKFQKLMLEMKKEQQKKFEAQERKRTYKNRERNAYRFGGDDGVEKLKISEKKKQNSEYLYTWKLPSDAIIIFDEAHRCKDIKTGNADILVSAGKNKNKILLLSATMADKPQYFNLAGLILGLYSELSDGISWRKNLGLDPMSKIHQIIFPDYASRMRIADLGNLFPDNKVIAKCFPMETAKEIEEQYHLIEEALEQLREQQKNTNGLGEIVKARMKIEMLKVPTFINLANQYLSEGKSLAIFMNFTQSLLKVAEELNTQCLIYGEQTLEERQKNIDAFNCDKSRLIVCNIKAGGVGISLHDTIGKYPRVSLISPSWSAQDVIQTLGRIHRASGKTKAHQELVYCAGTIEEKICKKMIEKIKNIAFLNDASTESYQIEGLIDGTEQKEQLTPLELKIKELDTAFARKTRLENDLIETKINISTLQQEINILMNSL